MRISLICTVVGLAIVSTTCMYPRTMQVSDYFKPGAQRALAEAAAKGRTAKIASLLQHGAKIDFRGREGMTALIWAILHQNKKGYQYLLEKGADPNLQMTESTMTSDGLTDGNSAMSFAAADEDPWYLEVTLKHGGNPNLVNPVTGNPVIFRCIMLLYTLRPRPRLKQLKMLITAGADLNVYDNLGFTPLMAAAIGSRYDMVYIMLKAGADPMIKGKNGGTLLWAIYHINTDPKSELYRWRAKVMELLRAKGINVEAGRKGPGRTFAP